MPQAMIVFINIFCQLTHFMFHIQLEGKGAFLSKIFRAGSAADANSLRVKLNGEKFNEPTDGSSALWAGIIHGMAAVLAPRPLSWRQNGILECVKSQALGFSFH
jgi:hypothetical protein